MYSPPIPRMVRAILAKLSEPRKDLGLIIINSPFSSNERCASSSSGKDILTSVRLRVLDASIGTVGAGVGDATGLSVETVTDGLGAETVMGLDPEVMCTVGG